MRRTACLAEAVQRVDQQHTALKEAFMICRGLNFEVLNYIKIFKSFIICEILYFHFCMYGEVQHLVSASLYYVDLKYQLFAYVPFSISLTDRNGMAVVISMCSIIM